MLAPFNINYAKSTFDFIFLMVEIEKYLTIAPSQVCVSLSITRKHVSAWRSHPCGQSGEKINKKNKSINTIKEGLI